MTRVATYVFIDLETTGLPKYELNKTRITELSMVVVKRRHVLDTRPGAAPRVQEKLTMCFNPRRMIHPEATDTSGLCNDLLEYQTDFNMNVFKTINCFLQCHEKPVCLIAQNGLGCDFPILKNHFEKLGVHLSDDILCADSLPAFYEILEPEKSFKASVTADNEIRCTKTDESLCEQIKNEQLPDNLEKKIVMRSDSLRTHKDCSKLTDVSDQILTAEFLQDFDTNQDLNIQQDFKQQNEKTPVHKKLPKVQNKISKARKKLFYGDNPKPNVSYKLKDVYERVLGRPSIEAHRAENDCIMTMEISVCRAEEFVEWVDNNNCPFTQIKAMRLGVPLGE